MAFVQPRIINEMLGDLNVGLEMARRHLEEYCARVLFLRIPSEQSPRGRNWLAARSLLSSHPYSIRWLRSDEARRMAANWNDSINFDVVHFDTLSLAQYRKVFTRSAKVLDHHNVESEMMLRRASLERHPLKRLYFLQEGVRLRHYEQRVCPEFDMNITCSRLDTERLKRVAPGAKLIDVPNGVDTGYFRPGTEPERPLSLVFAGNMSWYANASAMTFFANEVWLKLKNRMCGITIDVIGANPPPRLIALGNQDSNFRVRGFVPDVRPFVTSAALYICPIMDGGGTKLKILDALAMGKAIVAHPVACEGLNLRDGVDVVFARNPEEFVENIVALLRDPERRREISRNARYVAETVYSYSHIGLKLVREFERVQALRPAELAVEKRTVVRVGTSV